MFAYVNHLRDDATSFRLRLTFTARPHLLQLKKKSEIDNLMDYLFIRALMKIESSSRYIDREKPGCLVENTPRPPAFISFNLIASFHARLGVLEQSPVERSVGKR